MSNPLAAVRRVPPQAWARYRFVFIALVPIMALFLFLRVVPTAQAFLMSLFEWNLVRPAEAFVGLDNYIELLSDRNFVTAFTNTTIFARGDDGAVGGHRVLPRGGARRAHPGRTGAFIELLFFIPVLVPMVPVTLAWREIFNYQNGILNAFLGRAGDPQAALAERPDDGPRRGHHPVGLEARRLQHDHPARGHAGHPPRVPGGGSRRWRGCVAAVPAHHGARC